MGDDFADDDPQAGRGDARPAGAADGHRVCHRLRVGVDCGKGRLPTFLALEVCGLDHESHRRCDYHGVDPHDLHRYGG